MTDNDIEKQIESELKNLNPFQIRRKFNQKYEEQELREWYRNHFIDTIIDKMKDNTDLGDVLHENTE